MKDQIQQVFDSSLSLSVVDGRLKVVGAPETVDALRPLLQQYRSEIIRRLQADGAIQDNPNMPEHTSDEMNATGGGLLSADAVELISRGAELEYYAKHQGAKFAAHELGRLLSAVDIARDRSALDMACRELAAFIYAGAIQNNSSLPERFKANGFKNSAHIT